MVSAMHTIEEESIPPLSSARMGLSERSRRRMASAKTPRKCSSYSPSARQRILRLGSKSQYLLAVCFPARKSTDEDGGTEWIPT